MPDATAPPGTPDIYRYTSQRLRLSYADWGNHDAPLLVLVHGGRDHKRSWDWTARALSKEWHVIAPDLRGHGDSDWASHGDYPISDYVYDLATLIRVLGERQATIVGHSLGGNIALRYTGLYPERVRKLAALEGLGPSPRILAERAAMGPDEKLREWIDHRGKNAGKRRKTYRDIDAAAARMREANAHLSDAQAQHLTRHGVIRNEDGSVSFSYDPAIMFYASSDTTPEEQRVLWGRISCPTLLAYGRDSWASNPLEDGRAAYFTNAEVRLFEKAGHWLHHDQFEAFVAVLTGFLAD